jgi:hypothetical protein
MKLKYVVSGITCFIAFAVVDGLRPVTTECFDCFIPRGFPFRYYQAGGFAGSKEILWGGLMGEIAAVVVGAHVIARAWEFLAGKISRKS